ncbi:MAG TPA: hypothetical protein V6D05_00845 [Stenomitos sp.]
MLRKSLMTSLLAATVGASLAGCSGLPTGILDGLGANLSSTQRLAVQSMVSDSISSMQSDMDMDASAALTEDATFRTTQSLEIEGKGEASASATASLKIPFLDREKRFMEHGKKHIDDLKAGVRNYTKTQVDNGDGTFTVTATMEMSNKGGRTMKQVIERTYQTSDKTLIHGKAHMEAEQRNGVSIVRDRERTLQADGSYQIHFKSVLTRKDGKQRTIEWNTVEAADGTWTGSGTIQRFDGSVVTVTIVRNADGTTTTTTVDTKAKVEAEVTQPEGSTSATVGVTDQTSGQAAGETTVSDTTQVEASAE